MSRQPASGAGPLCVVLACFAGPHTAGRARHAFGKAMHEHGTNVLDEVVLVVNGKHKARVHDPHRVWAGTLTAALTWGAFGLCSGGGIGLVIWGVLGAICGGLYAYFAEHILTKTELQQIGKALPAKSSAVLAYVQSADRDAVLAQVPKEATVASVAMIDADLEVETATASNLEPTQPAAVTMLLVRYAGEHGARSALQQPKADAAQVELVFEVPKHGRTRVISPTAGVAAWAKSDVISWGAFGVAFGLIVGFAGNGGTFGIVETGVVKGVLWGLFGLVAGALYGLWAGRATSARRIRGVQALLPPDSATALVWLAAGGGAAEIERETRGSSAHFALGFRSAGDGAVLQAS